MQLSNADICLKIGKLDNTKNVYAVRCDCQNGRKKPKEILGINEVGVEI